MVPRTNLLLAVGRRKSWFSLEVLRIFVYRDWIDECLVHDSPRTQDPFSKWEMRTFVEVTLLRKSGN